MKDFEALASLSVTIEKQLVRAGEINKNCANAIVTGVQFDEWKELYLEEAAVLDSLGDEVVALAVNAPPGIRVKLLREAARVRKWMADTPGQLADLASEWEQAVPADDPKKAAKKTKRKAATTIERDLAWLAEKERDHPYESAQGFAKIKGEEPHTMRAALRRAEAERTKQERKSNKRR